ncbi:MAG: hypothetical protein WC417_05615, partial [Candidatus Omnitrophota bacterium]
IEPKRELIKGRPLEEFVTSDTAAKMAQQLLSKVQSWQFSEEQKQLYITKILEILAFQESADIRVSITSAPDNFSRLKATAAYWERVEKLAAGQKWLEEKSKYYHPAVKVIRQKIELLNNKLVNVGEGVLQFYLSGHTMADFFRGSISRECTSYGGVKFKESIGQVTDPAFFLFKVIEKGKWVGNVYTVAGKTEDGKFALYLEWFKLAREHQLVANTLWNARRAQFMKDFFSQFKAYLATQGFDYLIVTTATADTSYALYKFTQDQARIEANNTNPASTNLKKLSSSEHLKEGSLPTEYLQNFGGDGSNSLHSVTGYKIALDKNMPQAIQQKQKDLDYLEKLLGEMSSEETRLAGLAKERQEKTSYLIKKSQEEANAGRNAIAFVFKTSSEQNGVERQKIEYELNELRVKIREKKDELSRLAAELGLVGTGRTSSSPLTGKVASFFAFGILSSFAFTNKAQAQSFSSQELYHNSFIPLVLAAGVAGLAGLVYYIYYKFFQQKPERGSYYEREYLPSLPIEQYKFPAGTKTELNQVLDELSAEAKELLPANIDIRIPFEVGISRAQAVKALDLLYSTLLKHGSIHEFFKDQDFYSAFKNRTKELGLSDDFDKPYDKNYLFTVPKEKTRYEEDRRAEEFVGQYLNKIRRARVNTNDELLEKIHKDRARLLRKNLHEGVSEAELYAYYQLLLSYASLESKPKLDEIDRFLSENNCLGALSVLEEFFRIDIGAELISLEENGGLKDALNKVMQRELEDIRRQFNRSAAFQANKQQIIREAKDIQFELRLSERTADDLLRGVASGDCTSINGSAFYNTIPQFMFDPGLLAFKVIQDGKWVGNVYTIVAEKDNSPVLIVDAVQLPVWGRSWPVSVKELSDKVLEKIVEYADSQGFSQVLMSSFVSNFNAIHDHFDQKYPTTPQEIEKTAGFEHLKALDLWDNHASRNEYLETFSPHWNYSLKGVEPNNPKQELLLRTVWQRNAPEEAQEIQPADSGAVSSLAQANVQPVKKDTPNKGHTFRNFCIGIILAIVLLFSSGCSSAFYSRIGPLSIQGNTGIAFSQPKPNEMPIGISGDIGLGEKESKGVGIGSQGNARLGPFTGNIGLKLGLSNVPQEEAPVSISAEATLGQKVKQNKSDTKGTELVTEAKVRVGPATAEINPAVGLSNVAQEEAPISVSAKASLGEKVKQNKSDGQGVELATEAKVRFGSVTALLNPKVGLSNVPEGEKALDLSGKVSLKETTQEAVTQEKASVIEEVKPVTPQIEQIQDNTLDTQQIITQISEQIKAIRADLEQLRLSGGDLKIEISGLKAQLSDAQKQLQQLKERPSEELLEFEQNMADYARQIAALEAQRQQAQEELNWRALENEKASQELKQLQSQMLNRQQQAQTLQNEVKQLEAETTQKEKSLTQLQSQKSGLESSVNQLTQDKEKLGQELGGLRQQIGHTKGVLEEARIKSEPTLKNIWNSFSWQTRLGIIVLGLTGIGILAGGIILWGKWAKFKEVSGRVKALQQKADELEKKISTQRQEKEDLTKEITQKKALREESVPSGLKEEKINYEQAIQGLKEKIGAYQKELKSLEQQKQDLSRQIAARQNEAIAKQNELLLAISEAEFKAKTIKEEIVKLTRELAGLTQEKEKLKIETAGLKGFQQDVENKKQELSSLDKQKQNLEGEIRGMEAQRTAFKE